MTKNRKLITAVAGVSVLALLLIKVIGLSSNKDDDDDLKDRPVPVIAGQATSQSVPLVLAGIGTIQAYNTVTIHARVDGELINIAFREGQDVKKGDLLAQIDPRPFQAALANAQALLAKDNATLVNARRDLERVQSLTGKGYASRQGLDTQMALVSSLDAAVQADEATILNAQVQLGYTSITAPIDGRTGIRMIDQGNIIHAADATGIVVITQIQPIAAIFTLPQSKLPTVNSAQEGGQLPVIAYSQDDSTELGRGVLELVDNEIDPTTGTIRLKAKFPNQDHKLWPGAFVNIRLQVGSVPNGVTVPTQAVQRGAQGPYAYVIKADNTVEARLVEIGQAVGDRTLVVKGLQAGERVVVDGQFAFVRAPPCSIRRPPRLGQTPKAAAPMDPR